MIDKSIPLIPKNPDGPLMVLMIGRVSTPHQDIKNIEASYEDDERFLNLIYEGPAHIKRLGEQGSGMLVDRATIVEAEKDIESGEWDLVLMEDLSKAYRNPRYQHAFVQNCVDTDTRLICIGDNLDTEDPNWEVMTGAATLRHGLHIPDTRRRVRRTATFAFHHGGMALKVRFGYRKLTKDEAESGQFGPKGLRIAQTADGASVINEMRQRIHDGAGQQDIADWLNDAGIKPGPYVTNGYWSPQNVVGLVNDPILSGLRTFRKQNYKPIYRTGRHRRITNRNPEREYIPELAYMTADEQQAMIAALNANSRHTHEPKSGRANPRFGKPRTHSIFPAQHAKCSACGGTMHRALNDQIKCRAARRQHRERCWNHVQVRCELARQNIFSWLLGELERFPGHSEVFLDEVWSNHNEELARRRKKLEDIAAEIGSFERQSANLAAAIAEGGKLKSLVKQLKCCEGKLEKLRKAEATETHCLREELTVLSREELASRPLEGTLAVARRSSSFAVFLRRLLPRFEIVPVQSLDHNMVRPRARIVIAMHELLVDAQAPLELRAEIDLFEPPEHIRHLQACLEAKTANPALSLKQVAAKLGIGHMTVKRAFDYAKRMRTANVDGPYIPLTERPARASRWKERPRKSPTTPEPPVIPPEGSVASSASRNAS
jgi:hypothetical protein